MLVSIVSKASSSGITENDVTAHAEIKAISKVCKTLGTRFLEDCTLYTNIEPCLMCAGALIQARVKKLIFGASDLRAGACGSVYDIPSSPGILHKMTVISGVLEKECREIIQEFFKTRR